MSVADALDYLWSAVLAFGWICLILELSRAAIRGRFSFFRRKANGKVWPPIRSETPVRFWISWAAMAGPVAFISSLIVIAIITAAGEAWR